jgi:hypothetical protein
LVQAKNWQRERLICKKERKSQEKLSPGFDFCASVKVTKANCYIQFQVIEAE